MTDFLTPEKRRRVMSAIKSRDTKPELIVRRMLHRAGFRFRLHRSDLPGRPDIVLPRYRTVVLVHGCFWHGHDCGIFRPPTTREEFWREKISRNMARDSANLIALHALGWRVAEVWECELAGVRTRLRLAYRLTGFISAGQGLVRKLGYPRRRVIQS